MKDLLGKFGSFRRMVEAYWIGALSPQEEREIEDFVAKEMLASYKPVIVEAHDAILDYLPAYIHPEMPQKFEVSKIGCGCERNTK